MKNQKNKSIQRSKKTAISFVDVLGKEVSSLIIPGGGIIYAGIKNLVEHVREWQKDRAEDRLFQFHDKIFRGISNKQLEDFLGKKFSINEYYSLLNHVLQDEEDQKIDIYARIFQALHMGLIPESYRKHIITCSRELKYDDFELMRLIYINEKYEFVGPGNRVEQIMLLTTSNNPIKAYGIQTLHRFGCLSEIDKGKPLWPTELLKNIVELIYDDSDLTEISIGRKAKTADTEMLKIFIASKDLASEIFDTISQQLSNSYVRYVIANPIKRSLPLAIAPIIAICVGPEGSPTEKLKELVDISKKKVVKLFLPGFKEDNFSKTITESFDFTRKDAAETKRFVEFCQKIK
jgi:hypothetical protein